ncbi:GNAT family N-acetyltransferase [Aureimonas populi]|uniref:GNAT family N-acetyltransferase n=1 Tax=Aureimonas populi TaxID=1701758 RepID=A0ABW5CKM5_9HYPH|nr:GNAT family N-acetyltransferase [Aureimonas populi]
MKLLQTEVTQLVLHSLPKDPPPRPDIPRSLDVLKVRQIPLGYYRYLYTVGRAHHWTSRNLPDDALAREIHGPNTRLQVLYCDGGPAGWFELDAGRAPKETRLVHFAIMPEYRGLGLARHLLAHAIIAGFEEQPSALTVETNTLDHPAALPLYRKMGFRPVSRRLVSTPAYEE